MKPMYRLGFTIALLFAVPGAAGATNQRLIGSGGGQEMYLDLDSYRAIPGTSAGPGYKDVIVTTIYATRQQENNIRFQATRARFFIRCITLEGSLEMLQFYASRDLKGEPVAKFNYPTNWRQVDMETDVGFLWKYICTGGPER